VLPGFAPSVCMDVILPGMIPLLGTSKRLGAEPEKAGLARRDTKSEHLGAALGHCKPSNIGTEFKFRSSRYIHSALKNRFWRVGCLGPKGRQLQSGQKQKILLSLEAHLVACASRSLPHSLASSALTLTRCTLYYSTSSHH